MIKNPSPQLCKWIMQVLRLISRRVRRRFFLTTHLPLPDTLVVSPFRLGSAATVYSARLTSGLASMDRNQSSGAVRSGKWSFSQSGPSIPQLRTVYRL